VDDDNPIPEDTLEKMIEDDKDIVVAPILARNPNKDGKFNLCAFYADKQKLEDGTTLRLYRNITNFRDDGPLHKIDAAGTGCMLIKRKVLEAMNEKWKGLPFEFGDIKLDKSITVDGQAFDRRTMSEDCEFSERAIDLGFEIWLDDRIRPKHITGLSFNQWS
jgi:hypothetical protein